MKHLFTQVGTAVIMLFVLTVCHAQLGGNPPSCSAVSPMHTDCISSVNSECAPCFSTICYTTDQYSGEVCNTSCQSPIPFCDPAAIQISTETNCQLLQDACPDPAKPYYCVLTANRFDMCKNVSCGSITAVGFCTASASGALTKRQRILAALKGKRVCTS